jgi:hypothetical protein
MSRIEAIDRYNLTTDRHSAEQLVVVKPQVVSKPQYTPCSTTGNVTIWTGLHLHVRSLSIHIIMSDTRRLGAFLDRRPCAQMGGSGALADPPRS